MAKIIFTREDERLTESLLEEFDPARTLAGARMRDLIPATQWNHLLEYERRTLRRQIEVALMVAALGLRDGHYDVIAYILDDGSSEREDLGQVLQTLRIYKPLPLDVVEEYEQTAGHFIDVAVRRVLNLDPVS